MPTASPFLWATKLPACAYSEENANTLSPFFSWLKTPRHLFYRDWKHLVTFTLVTENTLWPLLSWLKTPCDLFSHDWKHLVTFSLVTENTSWLTTLRHSFLCSPGLSIQPDDTYSRLWCRLGREFCLQRGWSVSYFHPDTTVMAEWALKINCLSIPNEN